MKVSKKIVLLVMIAVAAAFALSFALPISLCPWNRLFIYVATRQANQMRVRLLCETDHAILLEACRELSRRCARGELKPGSYMIRDNPHPETSRFPKAILDLEPLNVYIDENDSRRVMVIMRGGMDHFGIEAYTEDHKKPPGSGCGNKELIPGLWYYDEGYVNDARYDEWVEAMLQKRKNGK